MSSHSLTIASSADSSQISIEETNSENLILGCFNRENPNNLKRLKIATIVLTAVGALSACAFGVPVFLVMAQVLSSEFLGNASYVLLLLLASMSGVALSTIALVIRSHYL